MDGLRPAPGPLDPACIAWLVTTHGKQTTTEVLEALEVGHAPHTIQDRLRRKIPARHASAALALASARRAARKRGLPDWERY